ncbi:MAG: hypothetical protein IJV64_02040 [Oscillospiraceae bacterium]|nr:hypothetical protein [Oscillospiraceae bacterium]
MAKCMCCNSPVTSGFVVCASCAESVRNGEISLEVMRFIGQLAEDISGNRTIYPCTMCGYKCHGPKDAHDCPEGVKNWLIERAKEFLRRDAV